MLRDPYQWSRQKTEKGASCILAGDINLQDRKTPADAFRHLRRTLLEADMLFGNLEGCLYHPGENDILNKPRWRHSDASMVSALKAVGFDAVGCANNVTLGTEAIMGSLHTLDEAGISHCGAGPDLCAARKPLILKRAGVLFGFLQFTARLHAPEQRAAAGRPGVAAFNPECSEELESVFIDIRELRSRVDVLVVSHHLRQTSTTITEPYQRQFAHGCVGAGADLVVGHGAHANQEIELCGEVPVFHCIGQLAFDWSAMRDMRDGLLIRLLIEGRRIASVSAVFVYRDERNDPYLADPRSPEGHRQLAQLRELSPSMALEIRNDEIVVCGG